MRKIICGLLPVAVFVSGCVSNDDMVAMQSKIDALNAQVSVMKTEMSGLQNELAVVKGQRLIRLPTGAPTKTEPRKPIDSTTAADQAFNHAFEQYRSGDIAGSITSFNQFYTRYPNHEKRPQVLFYLGQAHYTQRDYSQAQSALETLIYQTPLNKVDSKAAELLKRVYQSQRQQDKIAELDRFLNDANSIPAALPSGN